MLAIVPTLFRKITNRRREPRLDCSLRAIVTLGNGQRVPAEVVDVSRQGFRLVPRQGVAFPGGNGMMIEIVEYDRKRLRPVRIRMAARLLRRVDGMWAGIFPVPLDDYQMRSLLSAA